MYPFTLIAKETPWIDSLSLGIGHANGGADTYRFAVQHPFASRLWQGENMHLSGYSELAVGYWNNHDQDITTVSLSPVLQFFFCENHFLFKPYIELGLGITFLSNKYIYDDTIKQRNLSSHWQFEDRISIGFKIKKYDLNLRFLHYSNAGFNNPNDGMDMVQLTLTYHMGSESDE
ncbi:acyloxyacyl hydrolase [uncultured Shewanella sp.]|uniref:acyloxyacyl hydrolase n=1 Tax=uncultured Shewanella sp. TaxID=173975 RepID=UPI0026028667|nr:acyloxyacyl hydrolase [uncultured Shewanella sp.]